MGGGLGILRWINTVDTKGLGSRDLLFSSTVPSISLHSRPSSLTFPPPSVAGSVSHFAGRDEGLK